MLTAPTCRQIWRLCIATLLSFCISSPAHASVHLFETASFLGEDADDELITSCSHLGDVNGDGYDDFLFGAPHHEEGATAYAGKAYLVFGRETGWSLDVSAEWADASFLGRSYDWLGLVVPSSGGDLDGDNLNDIVFGAPIADIWNDEGRVYLFFGKTAGWQPDTWVWDADASFVGHWTNEHAGWAVSIGDVDGSGIDDLLIGAIRTPERGAVYVVSGRQSGWGTDVSVNTADAVFVGENPGDMAYRVSSGGDANGDGVEDLLVGADANAYNGVYAGKTYWIPGVQGGWPVDDHLGHAHLAPGSFYGEQSYNYSGRSSAFVEDVNGDGLDDIVIGAPGNDDAGASAGKAYLIFGRTSGWPQNQNLVYADASFIGEDPDDLAGHFVAGLGDVNGDGLGDLAVSSTGSLFTTTEAGRTYVILGSHSGWTTNLWLGAADGAFSGEAIGDHAGNGIGSAGDMNGDGLSDLLLSAPGNSQSAEEAGKVYLVLGGDCFGDADGDEYGTCDDCDDSNPTIYPGAPEQCNGVDDDCDGVTTDEDIDEDGDGFTPCEGDCNDLNEWGYPGAPELCNGLDDDCDGVSWDELADEDGDGFSICDDDCDDTDAFLTPEDADGDGYSSCTGDCDDTDPMVNSHAPEICNDVDDDCDGATTDEDIDEDGDGFTPCEGDCDDTNLWIHTGATEICSGADTNCDGLIDNIDEDGDGHSACLDDCDDTEDSVYGGAAEVCDGLDNDCDGIVSYDELDHDQDGFRPCNGDCDDFFGSVYPGHPEWCTDNLDNDCDGLVDLEDEDCIESDDDSAEDDDTADDDTSTDEPDPADDCQCRVTGRRTVATDVAVLLTFVWFLRRWGR